MISKRACHVTDPLKLVLLLIQRAVSLAAHIVSVQGVAEKKASGTVQKESRHAGRVIAVEVQARKTRVLGRRGAEPVGIHEHPIAEKAETEISDPIRCRRIIHTISQALIAERGGAGEIRRGEVLASSRKPESAGSRLSVLEEAVPPEHVQLLRSVAIRPHVEGVAVDDPASRANVVRICWESAGEIGKRYELQQGLRLR